MQHQADADDRAGFWSGFLLAGLLGALAAWISPMFVNMHNPVPAHLRVPDRSTVVIGWDPRLAEGESDPEVPASLFHGAYIAGEVVVANYASKARAERQRRRVRQLLWLLTADEPGGERWYDRMEARNLPPLKLAARLPPHDRCRVLAKEAENRWLDLVDAAKAVGIDQDDDPKCGTAGRLSSIWNSAVEATDPKHGEQERREWLENLILGIGWHAILTNTIPLPTPKE